MEYQDNKQFLNAVAESGRDKERDAIRSSITVKQIT